MSSIDIIFNKLEEKSSWLLNPYGLGFKLKHIFAKDMYSSEKLTSEKKMLIIKELFFCELDPLIIDKIYRKQCMEANRTDLYQEMGEELLQILNDLSEEDLSTINIQDPTLWSQANGEKVKYVFSHEAIINVIANNPDILRNNNDLIIKRRLIYKDYCFNNRDMVIIRNEDSLFDKIDERLIQEEQNLNTDIKKRTFQVEDTIEALKKEFDPKYKKEKELEAATLLEAIENLQIEKLKSFPYFFGNIENIIESKKDPKKWFYEKACQNRQLYRELKKLKDDIPFYWYV